MATPLGELLRQLRTDTDVQTRFHQSPAEYLHEHGWGDLDAADMHEALLLLADAAPAAEAADWIAAGESIEPTALDAAAALDVAVASLHDGGTDGSTGDTDDLDDIDTFAESDPDDLDGIATAASGTTDPDPIEPAPETTGDVAAIDAEPDAELDAGEPDLGALDAHDPGAHDPDGGFDPIAPDTPSQNDSPLTEDPADPTAHDLDPEPDWDDPS